MLSHLTLAHLTTYELPSLTAMFLIGMLCGAAIVLGVTALVNRRHR